METFREHVVNQYVLSKNHLLAGSEAKDVLQVVNDIIALHATSAGTPYMSLFARMKSFQRKHLDEEFYLKRNLLRLECMRGTLFITSTELAPMLFQATKIPDDKLSKGTRKWGISYMEYSEISDKLNNTLRHGGKPLHEIKKALPKEMIRKVERKIGKTTYRSTSLNVVLNVLMRRGMIISEKVWETTRTTEANRYMLFHEIYPNVNLESVESEEARNMLIKRYIKAFGPVTGEDIVWWTGFRKAHIEEALATMKEELVHVKINNLTEEYLMLEKDYEQLAKFKPIEVHSLTLLPYEDPYTKGYKVRDRLIDENLEKTVYVGGGVQPTILLNGKIIGTWNQTIEKGKGPIKLRFFNQPEKDIEKALQRAKAIGRLMADQEISVEIERD